MTVYYFLLAALGGTMLPVQAAINARLARAVGGPVWAAAISGVVVTVTLVAVGAVLTRGLPRITGIGTVPPWAWVGGLCGAVVLSATTATAPYLGTANMVALVMAGQVVSSMVLDNFGLLGLAPHPLTAQRVIAALLLLGGAALMR